MVSKKIIAVVFIIAIIMFAFSIIMMFSNYNANANGVPTSETNAKPDVEQGQVNIIINKPSNAP